MIYYAAALDSTEGFNLVISACKALLEHGIELKLVTDKKPDACMDQKLTRTPNVCFHVYILRIYHVGYVNQCAK